MPSSPYHRAKHTSTLCSFFALGEPTPWKRLLQGSLLLLALAAPNWASAESAPAAGIVRVELRFNASVDLDLYVTDPTRETVYFANTPSKTEGRLERDARCENAKDNTGESIEVITFPHAQVGTYRIGIDYMEACTETNLENNNDNKIVAFTVTTHTEAGHEELTGEIEPGHFLIVFREFELNTKGEIKPPPQELRSN